ncbi:hypothetical protein EC991_002179 [Linnemannia zychae]|nr:hypothetical protein EC991_002179 [Linnemannia zychae]
MGAANSSLGQGVDWIRNQGSTLSTRQSGRHPNRRHRRDHQRRRRRGGPQQDVEAQNHYGQDHTDDEDDDESDYDSLDDNDDERDNNNDNDDDSLLEGDEGDTAAGKSAYDRHPLYFGPAFHPVTEQSPAQLQLQRQIEQQLEQQQRQEYWQQQYRQQQQQQQQQPIHQQNQQSQQQPQLSPLSNVGGQQLSLNDFILPSAISGMGGVSAGGAGVGSGMGSPTSYSSQQQTSPMLTAEMVQDQLYRNSNLYNLISGLNVNPLLTEVQRAGTLDLSVLEQELDDVEGGWMDIEDDDNSDQDRDEDDTDIDYGYDGIVREMQPTKRSPTALACNINLKKSTLRLVKNFTVSNDPSIPAPSHLRPNYRLDFSFDSLTPCDVKLFWVVKEVEEDGDLGFRLRRLHHLPQPTTYHFPAGMNQRFISPLLPLYTMSLPELTMQGLPSMSMRMFQKRQQRQWQQLNSAGKEGAEGQEFEGEGDDETGTGGGRRGGRKSKAKKKNKNGSKNGPIPMGPYDNYNKGMPYSGQDEDGYKAIMEDQYYPLVILIEATKEYNPAAPVRSLPTPAADSPGLYVVDNQAISTFACFNISSEGGFEIKVMKQKVWINSTNYLIQEIYGFTDSVASPMPKAPEPAALKKSAAAGSNPMARVKAQADPLAATGAASEPSKRLSRADSIVSRAQELTKERPKRKKSTLAKSKKEGEEDKDKKEDEKVENRRSSAVVSLDIANPERVARRASVSTRRMSNESLESRATSAIGDTMSQAGDDYEAGTKNSEIGGGDDIEEMVEDDGDEEEEEEEEEEPNLVLLDAPECVICLSDVKDTIVLPCRHFCICSDCGDVLRRRAPQRCPICRQVFQALLHIASAPTRKPEFAMVHSPATAPASNPFVDGIHSLPRP